MVESLRIRVEHYLYRERLRLLEMESPYREQLLAENRARILELRHNENHDPTNGRFTSGGGGGRMGKTKYAPSKQRNHGGVRLGAKRYARLCGTLGTQYPGLNAGEIRYIRDASRLYKVKADGYGGMTVLSSRKIK